MTEIEAGRVIRMVRSLLSAIGEKCDEIACCIGQASSADYARFSADHAGHEHLVVHVNGRPLGANDLSADEIAWHEARHVVQWRRGPERFCSYAALYARAWRAAHVDQRAIGAFIAACKEHPDDPLEADAAFTAMLGSDFAYSPADALL